jgi:hypothetical protein
MICRSVTIQKQKLDDLYRKASLLAANPEMLAHWSRYLCVLTSGFIEQSVRAIYSEYAHRKSPVHLSRYVQIQLNRFQNPTFGNILNLAAAFSSEWEDELKTTIDDETKDAVNSIVSNRHNIAHGRDVGITMHILQRYYDRAVKILELIDEQCNRP